MTQAAASRAVALVETAYDLDSPASEWLGSLLRETQQALGVDLPSIATTFSMGPSGTVEFDEMQAVGGDSVIELFQAWQKHIPGDVTRKLFRPGVVGTVSGLTREDPGMLAAMQEYWGPVGIRDSFGITALDADGQGVVLNAGLPEPEEVDTRTRELWEHVCVHVTAAHRLRRALATGAPRGAEGGEAVLDASTMQVEHATGDARDATARERLRAAAISVDRARTQLRDSDPDTALAVWKGLVDGRWSLVDWFDTDGQRYMVARRNAPSVRDPRGLTPRERQVVAYTVLGESSKLIAYRLGLSESTISSTLNEALRKLGLSSRTQLVQMLALDQDP